MYVPTYPTLLANLQEAEAANSGRNMVTIPEDLLKFMLQIIVSTSEFDEMRYLRANSDVAEAVRRGEVSSGRMHYIGYGYFEGRAGGVAEVDTAWYEKSYPDVAQAIRTGKAGVKTAAEHFRVAGAAEGRAPNASSLEEVQLWRKSLGL